MAPAQTLLESAIAAALALLLAVIGVAVALVVSDRLDLAARIRDLRGPAPSARSSVRGRAAECVKRRQAFSPVTPTDDAAAFGEAGEEDERALVPRGGGPAVRRALRVSFDRSVRGGGSERGAVTRAGAEMLAEARAEGAREGMGSRADTA